MPAPWEANLRAVAAGRVDVILFTSSQQVIHALQVAKVAGIETELRAALATVVVASIGPTTSETLREQGLPVDLEPAHSKMGHLIREAAERSPALLERKRRLAGLLTEAERHPDRPPGARAVVGQPIHARLPAGTGRLHADLAHAASGALHAGVSQRP